MASIAALAFIEHTRLASGISGCSTEKIIQTLA
jgi:hypothetical protein